MKKLSFTLFALFTLVLGISTAHAQAPPSMSPAPSVENMVRLDLLFPTLGYELAVTDKITVYPTIGLWYGAELESDSTISFRFSPFIEPSIQGRYYYNLAKRQDRGRDIEGNQGEFIAAKLEYRYFTNSEFNNLTTVLAGWGLNRNFGGTDWGYFELLAGYCRTFGADIEEGVFNIPLGVRVSAGLNLDRMF